VDSQSVETTGVGGNEQRGLDPAKKVDGTKRHLLVDTEGLVLEARLHSARVPEEDGIRLLLEQTQGRFARLSHLWVDAGYQGRGKRWAGEVLGLSVEVVRKPLKIVPEKVAEVSLGQGVGQGGGQEGRLGEAHAAERFPGPAASQVGGGAHLHAPSRTFAWIGHNRRMAKDRERLCSTVEAFIHAAMARLMAWRPARD
jgi:transposase